MRAGSRSPRHLRPDILPIMNASDFDGVDAVDSDLALAPQRTSVLAILSLICAVICIIPGTGLLAVIFGISALVGINSSRGRVGATGLAVSGLILGLIVTMVWGAITFGALQFQNLFSTSLTQPAAQSLTSIDAGDFKNARAVFATKASAVVTDEQLQKFRTAYQAELGSFKSIPQSWDLIAAYGQLGPIMQKAQAQGINNAIPVPASFDKGTAVLLLVIDKNAQAKAGSKGKSPSGADIFPVENMILLTPSGASIELLPQTTPVLIQGTSPPPAPPADASAPAPDPATPAPAGGK